MVTNKLVSKNGNVYNVEGGKCDAYTGLDDLWITKNGEKVWGCTTLSNNYAYTEALRRVQEYADSEE